MKIPFLAQQEEKQPEKNPGHIHEWELVAKTIVESKPISIPNNDPLTKLSLTGMTTYLFQCPKCSEFKKEVLEGLETSALDRLLDKVDTGGPEYILRNGKTYVLLKQPPEQSYQTQSSQANVGNLPLRR